MSSAIDAIDDPAPESDPPHDKRTVRKLLVSLPAGNMAISLIWGAVPSVLLPLQVQQIDEASKATNLALVTTVGAVAAMVCQPLAGMVSDRTRTRFGKRSPWMLTGALTGGLSMLGMAAANTVFQLVVAWFCVQITYNIVQGPLSAILPDRTPRRMRGTFSAVVGVGVFVGGMVGQVMGAALASDVGCGYLVLAGVALLVIVLVVLANPEAPNLAEAQRTFSLPLLLRSFWVDPRKHPDFAWAFVARLFLLLGFFGTYGYQLYILQDYIGLGDDAVDLVPALGATLIVSTLLTIVVSGPVSDRIGRRKIFVIAATAVMGVGMIVPFLAPTVAGMFVYTALFGLGFGCYTAVDNALITEVLPASEDAAKDLGVMNIAASLPQTLAPAISGAVIALAGGYGPLFLVGIVFAVIAAVAVLPITSVR
ncbi:MFS transporter [Nocardia sp. NPDC003963]